MNQAKLEKKITELKGICFDYSTAMYELLGEFEDAANLTPAQKLALKKLKSIADKHISDEAYKEYLHQVYVEKKPNFIYDVIDDLLAKNTGIFIANILSEPFPEDDTDTLVIKED